MPYVGHQPLQERCYEAHRHHASLFILVEAQGEIIHVAYISTAGQSTYIYIYMCSWKCLSERHPRNALGFCVCETMVGYSSTERT